MKFALVHDWLPVYAGAERVLEQIYSIYPEDIYTSIYNKRAFKDTLIERANVSTSFLQKLPFKIGQKYYRHFLPLMPFIVEQYDLSKYDVILSCSYATAKGVLSRPDQLHITYCCSPIRYAWDLYYQYLNESKLYGIKGLAARLILHYIRIWDYISCNRADHIVTLSNYIARRIKKLYNRESTVIYPPVDVQKFEYCDTKENYYITASRMVPYKKIDLIVETFSKLPNQKLVVIGDGPDFKKIKAKASKNVELLGFQPSDVLKKYMQKAKAFIFAAEEDFGIVPLEAQACGTPVIAFGRGGAVETIKNGITGTFFEEQNVPSLASAILRFEKSFWNTYNPLAARKNSELFSVERFKTEYKNFVEARIKEKFEQQ